MKLIDPTLTQCCQNTEVMKYIHIGVLRIQEDAADRPSMASVLLMLSSDPCTLPMPWPRPSPVPQIAEAVRGLGESNAEVVSINEITFSELSPR